MIQNPHECKDGLFRFSIIRVVTSRKISRQYRKICRRTGKPFLLQIFRHFLKFIFYIYTMARNIAAESASSATKSFFGGITGTLGVIIGIIVALLLCCCSLVFLVAMGEEGQKEANEPVKIENGTEGGNSTENADSGESEIFSVGDKIKLGDITITVNSFLDNIKSENSYAEPASGKKYVAVDVKLENNGDTTEYITLGDFSIQDSDSYVYEYEYGDIKTPQLQSGDLNKGGSLRGWVVFEVPASASDLQLIFQTGFWTTKEVKINLQ
ncbi:DUF4352 domain-containing protein [Candidatus Dojkabacteria bacterium]|nr:DUF4352 domain-containing protein [Candidatus Dojkabacteria bacterium]